MDDETINIEGAKILLVDDQPANLDVLCNVLEEKGYSILFAPSGKIAIKSAVKAIPDLILMDVMMPEMDGFEACRRLKADERTAHVPVIFVTARVQQEDVIKGFEAGGVDYISKPFQEMEVLVRVETHVRLNWLSRELKKKNAELEEKNRELEDGIAQRQALKGQLIGISKLEAERWGLDGLVGESATIRKIYREIRLMQENATTVLISGESGTGKELIARAIHFGSDRKDAPFIPVNCNAIPGDLVEAVLFGHMRGAFTGATEDRPGYFELANGGTLFLDEIGDMPLALQGKLLRVLEDGEVWRVGAGEGQRVSVRVLAATNMDLHKSIDTGAFRQDLYFRLARFTVQAPALRDRRDDVSLLARHFLKLFAIEMGRDEPALSEEAVRRLEDYEFPGNVRELKNIIERALIESGGNEILPRHLYLITGEQSSGNGAPHGASIFVDMPLNLDEAVQQAEIYVIEKAMEQVDGNLSEVARLLGTSRNKVYRILNQKKE